MKRTIPIANRPLRLEDTAFQVLLQRQGPSLALWRAAEVAALRTQVYTRPICDLGCGDGQVTALVLPAVELGIDPDGQALARAAQHGIYQRLEAAAIEESALPPESSATIISNSVLEHLPNLPAVLAAVVRLLRPGGRLIFTTPTEAFSSWLALPLAGYATWRNRQLQHLNLWTAEHWAACLDRAGLAVDLIQPYLRPQLVRLWDVLELLQQITVARRRLFGLAWRRLPPAWLARLACRGAQQDLSAPAPGGGRLIVARKC